MLLKNAKHSALLPCILNSEQLVVTEPKHQDQALNPHCVHWLVHQWKSAVLKMLHQSHQILHAERAVAVVVVSRHFSFNKTDTTIPQSIFNPVCMLCILLVVNWFFFKKKLFFGCVYMANETNSTRITANPINVRWIKAFIEWKKFKLCFRLFAWVFLMLSVSVFLRLLVGDKAQTATFQVTKFERNNFDTGNILGFYRTFYSSHSELIQKVRNLLKTEIQDKR